MMNSIIMSMPTSKLPEEALVRQIPEKLPPRHPTISGRNSRALAHLVQFKCHVMLFLREPLASLTVLYQNESSWPSELGELAISIRLDN